MKKVEGKYCSHCLLEKEKCKCSSLDLAKVRTVKKSVACPYCKSIQDVNITEGRDFIEIAFTMCFYCKKTFLYYSNDGHTEKINPNITEKAVENKVDSLIRQLENQSKLL